MVKLVFDIDEMQILAGLILAAIKSPHVTTEGVLQGADMLRNLQIQANKSYSTRIKKVKS